MVELDPNDPRVAHLRKMATPLRMGQYVAPTILGRPYDVFPWVEYLEEQVLGMLARPGREIMIVSVPPQEGKTTYCGLWLPSWWIGTNPGKQVIFVSYNDEYASTWGLKNLNLLSQFGEELFGLHLSHQMRSAGNWKTRGEIGGMMSTGILGGITGNPGDLIIIDDVIKTHEDAASRTVKQKHIDEWDNSIQTRFQEETKVLIVATRWADDDLSGEVIRRSKAPDYAGAPVTYVNLQAMAEPPDAEVEKMSKRQRRRWRDPIGRKEGDFLEGRHSPGFFKEKQGDKEFEHTWNALYQGTPSRRSGSMFPRQHWRHWDQTAAIQPVFVAQRRIWDIAATEGGGDWSCGALVAKTMDEDFYVLDLVRFRHGPNGVMHHVKDKAILDGFRVPIRMEEERNGAGKTVIELYRNELIGWDFDRIHEPGTKTQRATPYSRYQNAGKVWLPEGADWLEEFKEEHGQMMGDGRLGRHDDQIDVVAYAVIEMMGRNEVTITDQQSVSGYGNDHARRVMESMGLTVG